MGIASGVNHLLQSVVELFQGVLATIAHFFQWALSSIAGLFQGLVHFVEGTLGFAIHNFFMLGTIAALVLGYLLYAQPRQQVGSGAAKSRST